MSAKRSSWHSSHGDGETCGKVVEPDPHVLALAAFLDIMDVGGGRRSVAAQRRAWDMNWREYWNGPHSIYVNERHRALHFELIARDIASLIPSSDALVLDYGCGEADTAPMLAARCGTLYLFDTASTVRGRLSARYGGDSRISVLDETGVDGVKDQSLDLIIVNSVLQYLTLAELTGVLDFARRTLKPSGRLALGDVIPSNSNAVSDARALLSFAWRGGFLMAAAGGLVRSALSDYRKLRNSLGLSRYSQDEMLELLSTCGFSAVRAERNIGHDQGRMLFLAKPRPADWRG